MLVAAISVLILLLAQNALGQESIETRLRIISLEKQLAISDSERSRLLLESSQRRFEKAMEMERQIEVEIKSRSEKDKKVQN